MRHLVRSTALLALVTVSGCEVSETMCDLVPPAEATVVTFNAGLAANFVAYAAERRPHLAPALEALDADVVCLQEVWTDEDVAAVKAALQARFPHQYHEVTEDPGTGGPAACNAAEADPLASCVNAHCQGAASLSECALGNCYTEYAAASDGCKTCLAANIGKNNIDAIFDACAKGAATYAFDGRNGLLLLSKTPLENRSHKAFTSYLNTRIALHATTTTQSGQALSAVCTHLTAVLPGVAYSGKYDSWQAEQAAQIGELRTFAASVRGELPQVVMGDFNTGPALSGGIDAEVADNYVLLQGTGSDAWRSVLAESVSPVCTWCADNPLNTENTTNLIDHVWLPSMGWQQHTQSADRVLDAPLTIDVNGTPTQSRLSDHYGLRVKLRGPAPSCG